MPIRTKQPTTARLKNGAWTHFSSLWRDRRIRPSCSFVVTNIVFFDLWPFSSLSYTNKSLFVKQNDSNTTNYNKWITWKLLEKIEIKVNQKFFCELLKAKIIEFCVKKKDLHQNHCYCCYSKCWFFYWWRDICSHFVCQYSNLNLNPIRCRLNTHQKPWASSCWLLKK